VAGAIASYGGATVRRTLSIARVLSFARRDGTLAVGLAIAMLGVSLLLGSSWLESAACGALAVPLWWRRRWPMGVLVTVTGAIVVYVLSGDPSPFFRPPLLVALYTVAAHGTRRRTLAVAAGTPLAAMALVAISSPDGGSFGGQSLEIFSQLGFALAVGEAVRSQKAFVAATRERAERAERDRELEARRRVDEERVRIAREVHDVIAHSVATISTQASVGVHVGRQEPERAVEALESIKRISVQALHDLRHALGALRDAADDGPIAPTPQLADLTELVQGARDAGLSVTLRMAGPAATLPSALQTTTYRIVQEGLTNVMRHAGGAHATVLISVDGDGMVIDVSDDGQGQPTAASRLGSRTGLVGLRERASAMGGDLHAGRRPDGGFRVHVTLPLEREPA
jgi:signal transduction histidine kinase